MFCRSALMRCLLSGCLIVAFATSCVPPQPRDAGTPVTALPVPTPPALAARPSLGAAVIDDRNAGRLERVAQIGKGSLQEVALSPDGSTLAVASTFGVHFYDVATLAQTAALDAGPVEHLAYADQGRILITSARRIVTSWRLPDGQKIASRELREGVAAIAAQPASGRVAFALEPRISERPDGLVEVARVEDLTSVLTLPDSGGGIHAAALAPNAARLAVAVRNHVRVWDLATGNAVTDLSGQETVTALAFTPSGDALVTGHYDGTVHVWPDMSANGSRRADAPAPLGAVGGSITDIAVSTAGAIVAVTSAGGLHAWDRSGKLLCSYDISPVALRQAIFTPDGAGLLVAGADQSLARWRTSDWSEQARTVAYLPGVYDVAFSPDSTKLASGGISQGVVDLWRVADGALLAHQVGHRNWGVTALAWDAAGEMFASSGEDNLVRLWSAEGEALRGLQGHDEYVTSVAFSPDGSLLASGSYDRTVRIWRPSSGDSVRTLMGHGSWVQAVAFSPDGATLASGSYDRTVRLWRVSDGTLIRTLDGLTSDIAALAFSPDGKVLAAAIGLGAGVALFDAGGARLRSLAGNGPDHITGVAFSPDGSLLAVAYYQADPIRIWRVADGALIAALKTPRDVHSVKFSPDGRLLAVASGRGVVELWGAR